MNKNDIIKSIENARLRKSKLPNEILSISGMSTHENRHLLNALLSFGNLSYLEVGCWRGSTCCSAIYNNDIKLALLIDNFSELQDLWKTDISVRDELFQNLKEYGKNYEFLDQDFFDVNLLKYGKFDVYFYDGFHSYESQLKALPYALDSLNDTFVFIVDDYSWDAVKAGTKDSIKNLEDKIELIYEEELIGPEWWNGLYIGLFRKK